jgi:hypothetical protein
VYQRVTPSGLGFSLPSFVTQTGAAIVKGITLTVPTPLGPIQLSPQQAAAAAKGATVTYTPPRPASPNPINQAGQFVEQNVPGGWGTVVLVGGGLLALVLLMGRRR